LNRLSLEQLVILLPLLDEYPGLAIKVGDNGFSCGDLKAQLDKLTKLRLLQEGRVQLGGDLWPSHLSMAGAVAQSTAKVTTLHDTVNKMKDWTTSFDAEDEVMGAVEQFYEKQGADVIRLPMLKAVIGKDGKEAYMFDGVLEVVKGTEKALVLVQCGHSFSPEYVKDATDKLLEFKGLMKDINEGRAGVGPDIYHMMLTVLKELSQHQLLLCLGGQSFDEAALSEAPTNGYLVVKPDGEQYAVYSKLS